MSSGVSQIGYWLSTSKEKLNEVNKNNGKTGGEGGGFLSYDLFMALSILGGFFALDHLYLRSPLTFIAKIIINILFFGVWWLYDASQSVFNDDVVKVFGLGIPSLGPKGIGAGSLASDVPDKKHLRFFTYGLGLLLGGLFGVDSFLIGDKQTGFIRLFSLITFIFAPIAIGWWIYKLFRFFFYTKNVVEENYEYFGAPKPPSATEQLINSLVSKIPIFGPIINMILKLKDAIIGTTESVVDTVESVTEAVVTNPEALVDTIVQGPLKPAIIAAEAVVEPVIKPITNTAQLALQTIDDVAGTAKEGIALTRNTVDRGANLVKSAINTAGETAKAASSVLSLAPMAASLTQGLTPQAVEKAKANLNLVTQSGGGNNSSNTLPFVLIGTLALIAVSGFIVSYRRIRQNEQPRNDDTPPQPRVL
jgi:hypothetical protein